MSQEKKERQKYFDEALSDFTYDVASGGAIRHLADLGYSSQQIASRLSFPTSLARIEQVMYRHFCENGKLLQELPFEQASFNVKKLPESARKSLASLSRFFQTLLQKNDDKNVYVEIPFGTWYRDHDMRMQAALQPLTTKEKEYFLGLPWEMKPVWHQLDSRMLEACIQLLFYGTMNITIAFLDTKEIIRFRKD